MIYYHGTLGSGFDAFEHDRSGLGTHFGTQRAARHRIRLLGGLRSGASRTISCRLFVKNPLRMRDIGAWDSLPDVEAALRAQQPFGDRGPGILSLEDVRIARTLGDSEAWQFLRRKIEDHGYDSVVYRNAVEDRGCDSYIV